MRSMISAFLNEGRISTVRVFVFCFIIYSVITLYQRYLIEHDLDTVFLLLNNWLVFTLTIALFSFPLDYISFWITKSLFFDRSPKFPMTFAFILIDFVCTTVLFLPVIYIINSFISPLPSVFDFNPENVILWYIIFPSIAVSVVLLVLQIVVVVSGTMMRIVFLLSKLNQVFAMNSRIHDLPFSFLTVVFGLVFFFVLG